MNARATARQQDALAPTLTPVSGGILRRRCACDNTRSVPISSRHKKEST